MLPISTGCVGAVAWVFREDGRFGVAVPLSTNQRVLEFFSGARLGTVEREIEGQVRTLLRLDSTCEFLRNEFAVVCAQFIDPGVDGKERVTLEANPLDWWSRWRQLLGNSNRDRHAYSSLGELLVIERLRSGGSEARWTGPTRGGVDIETVDASYEVKSTLSRYCSVVHVASQFQLNRTLHPALYLIHQRFEPSLVGDSIDLVIGRLVNSGMAIEELEALLDQDGLHAGCSARKEIYRLLESTIYAVDDEFPCITPLDFKEGVIPVGVVSIEYDVDLSALCGQSFI